MGVARGEPRTVYQRHKQHALHITRVDKLDEHRSHMPKFSLSSEAVNRRGVFRYMQQNFTLNRYVSRGLNNIFASQALGSGEPYAARGTLFANILYNVYGQIISGL